METNEPTMFFLGGKTRTPEPSPELTVREYAKLERVNERTVRRWIEKGAIAVRRTPGGRLRIKQA